MPEGKLFLPEQGSSNTEVSRRKTKGCRFSLCRLKRRSRNAGRQSRKKQGGNLLGPSKLAPKCHNSFGDYCRGANPREAKVLAIKAQPTVLNRHTQSGTAMPGVRVDVGDGYGFAPG